MNVIGYMVLGAVIVIALLFAIVLIWAGRTTKHKKSAEKRKKPYEFFQKVILLNWILTAFWITASYALAFYALAKGVPAPEINSAVTLALVSESLGVSLAYAITNASLKRSLNANGLKINKDTNDVSKIEGA